MNLIDVHAHMDWKPLADNLGDVLANARAVGVKAIVANGTNRESNRAVLALAREHELIKPALGFYPWHVAEIPLEELEVELKFIQENKDVIAIGEVGLDFKESEMENYEVNDCAFEALKERQIQGFQKIIELAKKKNLPIIVHSRKAELKVIEMLEASGHKKIVMHCFSGKKKLVKRIQENGWTFSIPVIVTKLQQFQEIVSTTPLSQLLTETDAPWLGPEPGLTNEPANVSLSIEKIAELKGLTPQEAADQIYMNYQKMFL